MIRWDKIKSRFALLAGIIGLVADMITILGTIGVSQILPSTSNMRIVSGALDSLILITALVGLLSDYDRLVLVSMAANRARD